jgi:uncharacterized protein (TIGR00299 family) protein
MKSLYLDCGAGISGNMFLGALIDLGLPLEILQKRLSQLGLDLPEFNCERVSRRGISGVHFEAALKHEHHHRHLTEIVDLIKAAQLEPSVTVGALRCFEKLAVVEAKIHGVTPEEIHFHEVGAVDAIIDIVGAFIGLEYLNVKEVLASPIRVGFGTVHCQHGEIPLPAPATVELLQGFTIYGGDIEGEWATPTGAALLATLTKGSTPLPLMQIEQTGYGAGSADRTYPNILRAFLGTPAVATAGPQESQVILETNVDDMNPEILSYVGGLLLEAGARDYYFTPVQMKKGRPGLLITVLADPETLPALEAILFNETSTFGVRRYPVLRSCLERGQIEVAIEGCLIQVKVAFRAGQPFKWSPEYEDCQTAARELNRPLAEIYQTAMRLATDELTATDF